MFNSTIGRFFEGRIAGLLCALALLVNAANAQDVKRTVETDPQRYLALMLLNLTPPTERGPEPDLIRISRNFGLNSVYLTIPWDKVYYGTPTDPPQWAKYDDQIKIATDLGMKVALRIHVGRSQSKIAGFWEAKDSPISGTGKPLLNGYMDTGFAFDNDPIANKAVAFIKETLTRYKSLHDEGKLLFVSVTNTGTQEGEYPQSLIENGKENSAIYDYSPRMLAGFQSFLKSHYTKIERLNFLWGRSYKSFENVDAPATNWDPSESFRQRAGKDWYIYRHQVLKKYTEKMIAAVKSVDPAIKFVADHGSVFDSNSGMRGTLGFRNLNEKADGIKINDSPLYDHRWSVDILKGDAPAGFIAANEVFVNAGLDNATHQRQIEENFAHGANMVAVVVSTQESMSRSEPFLRPAAANWLNKPLTGLTYTESVSYKLSTAVEQKGALNVIFDEWYKRAYADPNNPKPVRVILQEDLFAPEFWKDAANYVPYIFRPVPMQIIAVNRDFTYKLPGDTFSDVDGSVVKVEATGLPAWLTYNNGQFQGRPSNLGDYRITLKATDDEGGTIEAIFTIRVDTRENANKPPTVDANFSSKMVALNAPLNFKIPEETFEDGDGEITRVEASGLPAWLKYSNGTFTGTPTQLGDYRIIMKAYDDLNAFVETFFTFKVVEPQFLNTAPFASSTLPVKYAQLNIPFSYILPTQIFGDPDGYIASISVQNRPSWLNFTANTFSGTPTEEGEYRMIVRAYDNAGAYVETPFILFVQIPELRFELVAGGSRVDQRVIRKLTGNDVIPYDSLPPLLNVYAYGNFEYDRVNFNLEGPYRFQSTTKNFPFALYENSSGFAPYVGRYTLTVTALKADTVVVTNSIQFGISKGDSVNIAKDIEEWAFFPNPTESILNIRLPEKLVNTDLSFEIVTVSGKSIPLPNSFVRVADNLAYFDLDAAGLSAGIYFIKVTSPDGLLKQYKIFKK